MNCLKIWSSVAMLLGLVAASCASFHTGPMPGEASGDYVQLDTTRVRYRDVGAGSAVVLLHGFASSLDVWSRVIAELRQSHRVIALDLRGFGWTDRPDADYSPAAQAALVLALLDELGVERAAVVGHSWGASVALALALSAPQRISRIALYDAWVYEEQLPSFFVWSRAAGVGEALFGLYYKQQAEYRLGRAFYDPAFVSAQLIEDVYVALDRPGTVAAALATTRGQRFAAVQGHYASIAQPALLLWGREDRVVPVAIAERLVADLRHAELRVYPRCGHFPMLEAFAPSTRDLAAFLADPSAAGGPS